MWRWAEESGLLNHYKNRQQAGAADGVPPLTLALCEEMK
jgi:hypothetical protein